MPALDALSLFISRRLLILFNSLLCFYLSITTSVNLRSHTLALTARPAQPSGGYPEVAQAIHTAAAFSAFFSQG